MSSDVPTIPPPAAADKRRSGRRRAVRVLLFAVGVGVLAAIVAVVGWRPVAEQLAAVGWWFPVLVLLYAFVELAFAYGWKVIIGRRRDGPVSFSETFAAYLASLSVNYFTAVGGEPIRASLIAGKIGYPRALATVTVHRHAEMTSQFVYLLVGAGLTLAHFHLPALLRWAALGSLVLFGTVILWMTFALRRGAFAGVLDRLSRGPFQRLERFRPAAERLDASIGEIYERRQEHFLESVAWCFPGWCGAFWRPTSSCACFRRRPVSTKPWRSKPWRCW